jgi:hypothetical protein
MISRKVVFLATALLLAAGTLICRAQDASSATPSDSLADAARKARAQKKDSIKPAKVFTNDNVDDIKGTISVVGNEPAAESDKTAAKTADAKPASAAANAPEQKKDEGYWRAKFAEARKTLADDEKELDILQREFNLKQEQFYQDPTAAMKQQYSREDLDKTQSQIDAKKLDVEKDKQALSDLEDELRKSGGDAGWATEPSGAGSSDSRDSSNSGSGTSGSGTSGASTPDSGTSNSDSSRPL